MFAITIWDSVRPDNSPNTLLSMQLDIYLWFTSCNGNCIFCKKGQWLVSFPRSHSDSNLWGYIFHQFHDEKWAWDWIESPLSEADQGMKRINISWNDPIEWDNLEKFMDILTKKYPNTEFTLRLSNTLLIEKNEILKYFHKFEFSLYADNTALHNSIIWNKHAWDIFHSNLIILEKEKLKDKIFFQTIPIRENIDNLPSIISYIIEKLETKNSIKIIYPYFFPKLTLKHSLLSRKEILEVLIKNTSHSYLLAYCKLQNFPPSDLYNHLFLSIQK